MKKERKLPSYYQFIIEVNSNKASGFEFKKLDGTEFADYEEKLTKGQWEKASKYLTRELIPFCGYTYKLKPNVTKSIKIL